MRTYCPCLLFFLCVQSLAFAGAQIVPATLDVAGLSKVPLSVTLTGSLTKTVGAKTEAGKISLTAAADGSTSETWTMPAGTRTFKQASFAEGRDCAWTEADGKTNPASSARCFRPVPWFAPWLAAKTLTDSVTAAAEDTTEALRAAGKKRQLLTLVLAKPKNPKSHALPGLQRLTSDSAIQVTYDAKTNLPVRLDFQDVPETDPLKTLRTYVLFSDYREEGGFLIPHHIQRYLQDALLADIQINNVSVQ